MVTLRKILAALFASHFFQLILIRKMKEEVFGELYAWIMMVVTIAGVIYITVQLRKELKGESDNEITH
jgi:hypothetical protein